MSIHMSAAEYRQFAVKAGIGRKGIQQFDGSRGEQTTKYRNRRVYVYNDGFVSNDKIPTHGGIKEIYDSTKEYQRYGALRLMERAKLIANLQRQVPFVIQEAYTDRHGEKHKAAIYKADFVYEKDGERIVEDVKGLDKTTGKPICTESFKLKWKLLIAKYPDYHFQIY